MPCNRSARLSSIEAHEAVEIWWERLMTGIILSVPVRLFLKEFIPGDYAMLAKNPNYWGHDDNKIPGNQLPYIDRLKIIIIRNKAAAVEALRAGKIDALDELFTSEAEEIRKDESRTLVQVSVCGAQMRLLWI